MSLKLIIEGATLEDINAQILAIANGLNIGEPPATDGAPAEAPKRRGRPRKSASDDAPAESPVDDTPGPNPEPEPEPVVTRADVEKALRALSMAGGGDEGAKAMRDLLVSLGAVNEAGAPKLSALAEDKFAETVRRANDLAGELVAKAAPVGSVL